MNEDVIALLLGATEGAYALAASFGEYGIPAAVMDEEIPDAFFRSAFICDAWRVPGIDRDALLLRALGDFYGKHARSSLLLIPTTESFAAHVYAEREHLERMYILPQCNIGNSREEETPVALLLAYVDRMSELHTYYATVCAACANMPLAVIPARTPDALLSQIPLVRGFSLYGVTQGGALYPFSDDGALSSLVAFPSAADASLVEWILADLVLCTPLPVSEEVPEAVFSLMPYKHIRPYVLSEEKDRVFRLSHSRLFLSLWPRREEKKSPRARMCLRRYALANWQKKTKIKK